MSCKSSQVIPFSRCSGNANWTGDELPDHIRGTQFGSSGSDTFVLKPHEGTLLIKGFNLSERDRLELAGGLTYDQIVITPGTRHDDNTLIRTKSGELLAILKDVQASTINNSAFLTQSSQGSVVSQGDRVMRANVARDLFRVDGTGVTIGIISDSFDISGNATKDYFTGDLQKNNIKNLKESPSGGKDEGRAMMQLIHDIAPGAKLLFWAGGPAQASFAQAIQGLVTAGANIIVDDLIYATEPMFQDGFLNQLIDQVVANGVAYFTSAGNSDRSSYQSPFRSAGFLPGLGELHDFDPGPGVEIYQNVTIPERQAPYNFSFQWDSPLGRSPNDLDIYLLDQLGNIVPTELIAPEGDPIKVLSFSNDGSYGTDDFKFMIAKHEGPDPGLIKYIAINSGEFKINDYNTNSPTVFGHANATGAFAVGAVPYYARTLLEPSSSVGGTPILFDSRGDRLPQPESRQQPKLVAPDGVNITATTDVGQDSPEDVDSLPNFFGTSAAAPHVAAVAALILQAHPSLRPADLYDALESTALDLTAPVTPGTTVGFDNASGFGLIQADRAVAKVAA